MMKGAVLGDIECAASDHGGRLAFAQRHATQPGKSVARMKRGATRECRSDVAARFMRASRCAKR
jgi:hypothetical protein